MAIGFGLILELVFVLVPPFYDNKIQSELARVRMTCLYYFPTFDNKIQRELAGVGITCC